MSFALKNARLLLSSRYGQYPLQSQLAVSKSRILSSVLAGIFNGHNNHIRTEANPRPAPVHFPIKALCDQRLGGH